MILLPKNDTANTFIETVNFPKENLMEDEEIAIKNHFPIVETKNVFQASCFIYDQSNFV